MSDQQLDTAPIVEQLTPESTPEPITPELGYDPNDEDFQAFNTQLTRYLGVDANALKNYVRHVESQARETSL